MTDLRRFEFFVPLLPDRSLGPNGPQSKHWATAADARSELRGWVRIWALQQPDPPRFQRARVAISYRYRAGQKSDGYYRPDDVPNAVSALKSAYDGLVDAELLPDDNWRHLELGQHEIRHVEHSDQQGLYIVVIELTPMAGKDGP